MSKNRTRRRFSTEFKARVAMEAARGVKTVGTIADEIEFCRLIDEVHTRIT